MNWSHIEIGWNDYQASAKRQWSKLSAMQISDTLGRREFLARKVQEFYALSKDETERQVAAWQSKQIAKQDPAQS